MDFPIIIIRASRLSLLGASGVILKFYSVFDVNSLSKQNSPRWDAAHLGLFCLPMSHKRDTRLKFCFLNIYIATLINFFFFCICEQKCSVRLCVFAADSTIPHLCLCRPVCIGLCRKLRRPVW